MDVKYIVFDLDGTLIDSCPDIAFCLNDTLTKFGIEKLPQKLIAEHVGTGIAPLMQKAAQTYKRRHGKTCLPEMQEYFGIVYEKNLARQTKIYDGVKEILAHFEKFPKFVLTNKSERFTGKILEGLGISNYFIAHYSRESFAKRKPDPLPLLQICKLHDKINHQGLMVGDTPVDVQAAKSAGVKSCAVTYGYGSNASLKRSKPDLTIDHIAELKEIIR